MSTKTQLVESYSAEDTVQNEALQSANRCSLVYIGGLLEDDILYRAKEVQVVNPEDIFVEKIPNNKPNEMDVKNKNEEENMEAQCADLDNADDNGEEDEDDDDYVTGNKNYYEMEYDHYD